MAAQLENLPSEEEIGGYVERISDAWGTVSAARNRNGTTRYSSGTGPAGVVFVTDEDGDMYVTGGEDVPNFLNAMMSRADKRQLLDAVFSRPLPDGRPSGVYVSVNPEWRGGWRNKWIFTIKGQMEFEAVLEATRPAGKNENLRVRSRCH